MNEVLIGALVGAVAGVIVALIFIGRSKVNRNRHPMAHDYLLAIPMTIWLMIILWFWFNMGGDAVVSFYLSSNIFIVLTGLATRTLRRRSQQPQADMTS